MEFAMLGANSLSRLNHRLRSRSNARQRRRRASRRLQVAAEVLRLEERWMLSLPGNQIPPAQVADNVNTPVTAIFWNGGVPATGSPWNMNPDYKDKSFLTPGNPAEGAMKTVTLTNNSQDMIYPFIRGENIGKDPNATPGNQYYDPLDVTGQEYREYIGYQNSAGTFIGLPKGASITFQVPLVLWDGDNFYIATDPSYLTADQLPYVNVYNYNPNAKINIAKYTGQNSTEWVTSATNYPTDDTPAVVFYRSGTPKTVLPAAPAQLVEWTYRDPYLKQFINDPLQTYPLLNYDASYVNNLTAPVSMEASNVPIYYGNNLDEKTPPTYYLPNYNYGWNPTDGNAANFGTPIADFFKNKQGTKAYIGDYFNGKGWPKYYNPNEKDVVIPSGANVFLNSPLTDQRSPYAQNYYLLTSSSNGAGPIEFSFGGALPDGTDKLHFAKPNGTPEQVANLNPGMEVLNTGKDTFIQPGTTILKIFNTGKNANDPYLLLSKPAKKGTNSSGYALVYKNPVSDYAVTDITKLWYSWAHYYVTKVFTDYPKDVPAEAAYNPPADTAKPQNEITLTSAPDKPLLVGMTVKGEKGGIRDGTTILGIQDSKGNPIGSATQAGDKIFLSLLPIKGEIPSSQKYAFGKPTPIPYTDTVKTYDLTFNTEAEKAKAKLFAGSVYAVMSAEAGVSDPPPTKIPKAADVVARVIQFYAVLPTDGLPGGKNLTGQVRDVVKSVLRGVWNFTAVPEHNADGVEQWYPNPSQATKDAMMGNGPAKFNLYNLDPYVWFVHDVQGLTGYAFSVDDDVANPSAPGPVLAKDSPPPPNAVYNHSPNDLQIAFGGLGGLTNPNPWFPTIPWGDISTMATITKITKGDYANSYMVTFYDSSNGTNPLLNPKRIWSQINNPGDGQVGAYISSPGNDNIPRGTTLIFKGPNGDLTSIVMKAPKGTEITPTSQPIPIVITGTLPKP
jgi:hypothetical protein